MYPYNIWEANKFFMFKKTLPSSWTFFFYRDIILDFYAANSSEDKISLRNFLKYGKKYFLSYIKVTCIAQKMKFSIKDFLSKCD